MKELQRLAVHGVLLLAGAAFAYVESRPDDPAAIPPKPGEVELWGNKADAVSRIEYKDERMALVLQRMKDEHGVYYRGQVNPVEGGADAPDADDAPPKVKSAVFLSVDKAEKLAERLAPFRAKRRVGEVKADGEEAFGLNDVKSTLTVEVAGAQHKFAIGTAQGAARERYARYEKDKLVYALDGAMLQDLFRGKDALSERRQHTFNDAEVHKATIHDGTTSRAWIRGGTTGRRFWADEKTPDANDETMANWLSKVQMMQPRDFVESLPEGTAQVVRVDFEAKRDPLGFTALHVKAGDPERFFLVTEMLRMPAEVPKSMAEQVREDLGSVMGRSSTGGSKEGDAGGGSEAGAH